MNLKTITAINSKIYVDKCDFGKGVFAAKNISKGELILTFTGKIITPEKVLAKGKRACNALQIGNQAYIDIEKPGVLVNHSCNPNAGIVSGNLLIALRDIYKNEEIFYDYSTTMSENSWTMECRCGASNCRGIIKDFHYLPADIKEKYLNLGVVQDFIVRECYELSNQSAKNIRNALRANASNF